MRIPKLRRNGDGRAFAAIPGSNGRRAYFGRYGTKEAEAAYQQWLVNLWSGQPLQSQSGPPTHSAEQTIADVAAAYVAWIEKERSRNELSFAKNATSHLCRIAGQIPASRLGPKLLLELQEGLIHRKYRRHSTTQTYSRQHINKTIAEVKRMVRWCCARELLPPEVYSGLKAVAGLRKGKGREAPKVPPVLLDVFRQTLPFLKDPFKTMALVQFYCGMRPGEICRMRIDWIDPSGLIWTYSPDQHKTASLSHTLTKAVPPVAQSLLKRFMVAGAEYVFRGKPYPDGRERPVNRFEYAHEISRAIERARNAGIELDSWTPNQLRHTIATLIRQSVGIEAAQLYLGHSRVDITHVYAERTTEAVKSLATRLEETLFAEFNSDDPSRD